MFAQAHKFIEVYLLEIFANAQQQANDFYMLAGALQKLSFVARTVSAVDAHHHGNGFVLDAFADSVFVITIKIFDLPKKVNE